MKYIFGNWKMYLDYAESVKLASEIKNVSFDEDFEVSIFPTALAMVGVKDTLNGSNISVGAQDVMWVSKGAYTGAISAEMFKQVGCKYALVGHSERRHVFDESSDDTKKKIRACLDAGLIPVLCIGETKADRDNDKVKYRIKKQIVSALDGLKLDAKQIIFAYEPVWAIGTDTPCLPADADDIHGWIKMELSPFVSGNPAVLYGGSVDEQNMVSYLVLETVDGVLIGGASAKIESFATLLETAIK